MNPPAASGPTSRWALVGLCCGTAALEALALVVLGVRSGLAIAPQVSSPAPLGLFHDLRWLIVYQDSWLSFALELAAIVVLRSAFSALAIRAAWPVSSPCPGWRRIYLRCFGLTVLAAILLAPWTILLFGMAVVPISWLFFAAVPSALVFSLLLSHGSISADWWRRAPAWRALGWLALSFLAASVASGLISLSPEALAIPVAAATGLFNAWAWVNIVRAIVVRSPSASFRPVVPVAIVLFLAVVLGGTAVGFSSVSKPATAAASERPGASSASSQPPRSGRGMPVLVATGFWSNWNGSDKPLLRGDYLEARFSYRGLGADGRPLAYSSADTERGLPQLVRLMSEQVQSLYQRAHRPVSIVAESEGALVAKTYLDTSNRPPVRSVVLLSPLVSPGRVYYPAHGDSGWGVAGRLGWQGLNATINTMASIDLAPSEPLTRSIVANGPALGTELDCPVPRVREYALLPLADSVASPSSATELPATVLPAFHGGMIGDPAAQAAVAKILSGSSPGISTWSAAEDVLKPAAAAWQVPDLAPGLNSAWGLPGAAIPTDRTLGCSRARSLLASGLARGGYRPGR